MANKTIYRKVENKIIQRKGGNIFITDIPIDDQGTGTDKTWSSSKISTELSGKVDKVTGKELSTNDYSNSDKSDNAANTAARHTHTNKTILDAITEIFTTTLKTAYDSTVTWVANNSARLAGTSGTNTGDESTATIQSKRPLKTVATKSLEGTGRS